MAKAYTETKYLITVINNQDFSKRIYTSDEILEWLSGNSDIRQNSFWRLLYHQFVSFECEEDYKVLGLPYPVKDWIIYYNMN